MNNSVSRKYMLVLAALAVLILVVGALFRPKKSTVEQPSPSETASLQARVRRDELGETAAFFAQRAQTFGRGVVYDQEQASSAVAWEKPGQVLTTGAQIDGATSWPVSVKAINAGTPPIARPTEQDAGRWVLIVGRTVEGQLLWSPAVYGGTKQSTCNGEGFTELISNARIDRAFSGAGVFDLDGLLVGIVAPCGTNLQLVSVASIQPLLMAFHKPERRIRAEYGFEVSDLDADGLRFFSVNSGLLVTELEQGGLAERAGLKAGDVIVGVGATEVATKVSLSEAVLAGHEESRKMALVRQGRKLSLQIPSIAEGTAARTDATSLGIRVRPPDPASELIDVMPGTPAEKAGLRTGDRLIRIEYAGQRPRRSKILLPALDGPFLAIVQRGRAQRAALVSK